MGEADVHVKIFTASTDELMEVYDGWAVDTTVSYWKTGLYLSSQSGAATRGNGLPRWRHWMPVAVLGWWVFF